MLPRARPHASRITHHVSRFTFHVSRFTHHSSPLTPSDPMPSIPIIMPQLGESIAEATVVNLLVPVGDHVQTDQDIIEVETSKATMNVASPCPGRVEKFLVKPGESYPVGAVLGYLEASPEDAARLGLDAPPAAKDGEEPQRAFPPAERKPRAHKRASSRPCGVCPSRRMPPAPVTCPRA